MFRSASVVLIALGFALGFPSCGSDAATSAQALSCAGSTAWVRPLTGDGTAGVRALASMPDGTFIAVGHFTQRLRVIGTRDQDIELFARGGEDVFIARFADTGKAAWIVQAGGPADDRALAVTLASDGAIVVVGAYGDGAYFGEAKRFVQAPVLGGPTGFVARYDQSGDLVAFAHVNVGARTELSGVAPLEDGSVVAVGTATRLRPATFPHHALAPGTATLPPDAVRHRDIQLGKPGHTAALVRERLATPFSPREAEPPFADRVAMVGDPMVSPAIDLGGRLHPAEYHGDLGLLRTELVLARVAPDATVRWTTVFTGSGAIRVERRMGPDGKLIWTSTMGGRGHVRGLAVAAAGDGRIAVAGELRGAMTVPVALGAQNITARGDVDAFVARADKNGRVVSLRQEGEHGKSTFMRGIVAMPNGDVALATRVSTPSDGLRAESTSFALTRVRPDGKAVWEKMVARAPMLQVNALAPTPDGNLLVAGSFAEGVDVWLGLVPVHLVAVGCTDAFVLLLGGDGGVVGGRVFGGDADEQGDAVLGRADGSFVVAGSTTGPLVVGFGEPGARKLEPEGAGDAFLTLLR